jgi:hypothetical protein
MAVAVLLLDISIVAGSSSLTDGAYQPNPVQISIGRHTITWTNDDDSQLHTVTSGVNGQSDGRFDSSIMAPAATAVIFLKSITFEALLSRIGIIWQLSSLFLLLILLLFFFFVFRRC